MKIKFLSIVAAVVLFSSCQKENINAGSEEGKNLDEISVPAEFDWKTIHDVNFSVSISDSRFSGTIKHVISIYVGDPANGGQIVSKGAATPIAPFNTRVALPKALSEVYIEKTAPDGSKISGPIAVTSTSVSASAGVNGIIGAVGGGVAKSALAKNAATLLNAPAVETSPACPSGANVKTISGPFASNDWAKLGTANQVYAITGDNYTLSDIWEIKGKVYICGTNITLSNAQLGKDSELYILNGASVTFSNFNFSGNGDAIFKNFGTIKNGLGNLSVKGTFYNTQQNLSINGTLYIEKGGTLINYAPLTVTGNLDNAGTVNNYSNLTVNGNLNTDRNDSKVLNTGILTLKSKSVYKGTFTNRGTLNVTSGEMDINGGTFLNEIGATLTAENTKMNVNGIVTNSGTVLINELNTQGSGEVINNCSWKVKTNFNNDATLNNHNYFYVGGYTNVNGSSKFNLYSYSGGQKAMFTTGSFNNFAGNSNFDGKGSDFSLVEVRTSVGGQVNNGSHAFVNKVYVSKPSTENIPASKFKGGAAVLGTGNNYYIAKDGCNDHGFGTAPEPVKKDTDGDGVIDEEDAFPTDPTKAFVHRTKNYFEGGSSVAFEDNWPFKGDYDLNDIVITYRYQVISNSANKVVRVEADYELLATGGSFKNGAGIQFNIPASKAKNFTSSSNEYLESGQDSVVVILFENSRNEQLTWNTDLAQPSSATKSYSIGFDVEDGPTMAAFGIGVYNPFIWNNTSGKGRGYETHLLGKAPTNKVDANLFGTADDNSIAGRKYSTRDNLPYALEFETAPFKYPLERVAITKVYLKFAQWASSGGVQFKDWYTNAEAPGYLNNSLIYKR